MFITPNQQIKPVSSPLVSDKELLDFSGNVQDNLDKLFQVSHEHVVEQIDKDAYAALTTDAQRIQYLASWLGLQ